MEKKWILYLLLSWATTQTKIGQISNANLVDIVSDQSSALQKCLYVLYLYSLIMFALNLLLLLAFKRTQVHLSGT